MIGYDVRFEAPITAKYHREAIDQIIECVEDGVYCALLGPRLCGKTVLLRYIQRVLTEMGWVCAYIDLLPMRAPTLQGFFSELARLTTEAVQEQTNRPAFTPVEGPASSSVFRSFLTEGVLKLGRDLVLIIEHLETVPTDLAQALLTSLRAAYMDQQTQEYRLVVILSGALSLATLTVGESSPFRGIARRVFIGDLTPDESCDMISDFLAEERVGYTPQAQHLLLDAASGDTFLIRKLCQRSAALAFHRGLARLGARHVRAATHRFLRYDVIHYAPLLEAVRMIEEDPDLLQCILILLNQESARKSELPLPLSPDLDPLYLTGIVEAVDGDRYRVQNLIYRSFLETHFSPGRVGHVLAMTGRWDMAIDYLEASLRQGNIDFRVDLLPATINSMYAADNLPQAAEYLTRALSAAFEVNEAEVWYAPPQEKSLRLIRFLGEADDSAYPTLLEISIQADRLEARALRQGIPLRGDENGAWVRRAIPLKVPGEEPIGVVSLWDRLVEGRVLEQRRRDLQLVGFLNQAARALQAVSTRRQELALAGRMQQTLLPAAAPAIPGWGLAAAWAPARETSGDFYDFIPLPEGKFGIVIADVADKGMAAALYMALSRTHIRTFANDYPDKPCRVMTEANARLIADVGSGNFVTAFFGLLDPTSGDFTYCNAGHNPPYLFDGSGVLQLHRTGMALGVSEEAAWEQRTIQLPAGALVLLYTDGVIDALDRASEPFGEQRLVNLARTNLGVGARPVCDTLLAAVQSHAAGAPQFDDMTMVVVKRELPGG
jgi:serine phosphatase RsbU (regulator of sigma subunit)